MKTIATSISIFGTALWRLARKTRCRTWELLLSFALVVTILSPLVIGSAAPFAKSTSLHQDSPGQLKLIAEYKNERLMDISTDGRWLLFCRYTNHLRAWPGEYGRKGVKVADDVLSVVDRESDKEVGHTVSFEINSATFVPGTHWVVYPEHRGDLKGDLLKFWDPESGQTRVCLDGPAIVSLAFLDQRNIFALVGEQNAQALKLTLQEQAPTTLKPLVPRPRGNPGSCTLSSNKRFAACDAGGEISIWDLDQEKIVSELPMPEQFSFDLQQGDTMAYTPDGKLLIVTVLLEKPVNTEPIKSYLLFYDTQTYQLVRQWYLNDSINTALAISPDGKQLAFAFTESKRSHKLFSAETVQGIIELYDLNSHAQIATAAHARKNYDYEVEGSITIRKLAFTPDGKYLLSSTAGDTRIWEIPLTLGK